MKLQLLTPQPPAFVAWEDALTDAVGDALATCRSDAQAIVEAHAEIVVQAWRAQLGAQAAAGRVIAAATESEKTEGARA